MKQQILFLFLIGITGSILGCGHVNTLEQEISEASSYIQFENTRVSVEVMKTEKEKQQGLMHRTQLNENEGMLFVWDEEAPRSFWMKNTRIPLDIIFLNRDKRVINIEEALPCSKDPCKTYVSEKPAQYVLEVRQGWSEKNSVIANSHIDISLIP